MLHPFSAHGVDYATPLRAAAGAGYVAVAQRLLTDLPARWDLAYRAMSAHPAAIVTTAHAGRLVRLDVPARRPRGKRPPDRLVAVYGRSRYFWQADDDPLHAFLARRGRGESSGASAGWLDVGTLLDGARHGILQNRKLTEMERFCSEHPGTFFFVRPLYETAAAHPLAIEYGVLRAADDLWLERFAPEP